MTVLDPAPLVAALVDGSEAGEERAVLAAAFHETLGRAAADVAIEIAGAHGLDTVALTGGVFQNARFSAIVEDALVPPGCESSSTNWFRPTTVGSASARLRSPPPARPPDALHG